MDEGNILPTEAQSESRVETFLLQGFYSAYLMFIFASRVSAPKRSKCHEGALLGGEPRPVKHLLSFPGGPEDGWGRAHADPDPGGRRRVSQ